MINGYILRSTSSGQTRYDPPCSNSSPIIQRMKTQRFLFEFNALQKAADNTLFRSDYAYNDVIVQLNKFMSSHDSALNYFLRSVISSHSIYNYLHTFILLSP